ncbi:MAG: four helix bundle protein [Acidobacteria bacterium]|nr:MAG: four helix bundle protein [Acidobacteriota bacterium]REK01700.1 MAG: four helix bundle protein [Acidobacteriota bacterium]REK14656.1 MAG: four helix bundle protein [Acidobacteriota bacterium]REK45371.1 MAG: four helix bundle protein [Acidobacteriota bacterium]
MNRSKLVDRSFAFALRIIKLSEHLESQRKYVLARQVLRSGTSVGANITEAQQAESRKDFAHKLGIANKEAFETEYWLKLLRDSGYITNAQGESLLKDCNVIQGMLVSALRTLKKK